MIKSNLFSLVFIFSFALLPLTINSLSAETHNESELIARGGGGHGGGGRGGHGGGGGHHGGHGGGHGGGHHGGHHGGHGGNWGNGGLYYNTGYPYGGSYYYYDQYNNDPYYYYNTPGVSLPGIQIDF